MHKTTGRRKSIYKAKGFLYKGNAVKKTTDRRKSIYQAKEFLYKGNAVNWVSAQGKNYISVLRSMFPNLT